MRPIYHPPIREVTVEGILYALSDPVRVSIYAEIAQSECPQICSSFLRVNARDVPKSTLSVHFRILREAGLIYSERHGVEMRNRSRCAELKERFGDLVGTIIQAYRVQRMETVHAQKSNQALQQDVRD